MRDVKIVKTFLLPRLPRLETTKKDHPKYRSLNQPATSVLFCC